MGRALALTGATGFVGGHLARILGDDYDVTPLSRKTGQDLRDRESLRSATPAGSAVVHLAYSREIDNVAAARNLAEAAVERRVSRFVHVSTAVVVGPLLADRIDESTPERPGNEYEREKLAIEEVLRETLDGRVDLRILRPTAVFGPNGQNLLSLAGHLRSSSRAAIAMRMAVMGQRAMNLVAVENVVAAIRHLLETTSSERGPFLVTDDHARNEYTHVAQRLMEGMGMTPVQPPLDVSFALRPLLRLTGRGSNPRARFASDRLRATGYAPVTDFDDAVRRFGAWYCSR